MELQQLTDTLERNLAKSVDIESILYRECPNCSNWHQFKSRRAKWVRFRHHWSLWWSAGARSGAAAEVGFGRGELGW